MEGDKVFFSTLTQNSFLQFTLAMSLYTTNHAKFCYLSYNSTSFHKINMTRFT